MTKLVNGDRSTIRPASSSAPEFDRWLDRFFADFYERRPVDATFAGIHEHDHRLPDFSPEATKRANANAEQLLRDLAGLPEEPLTQAQRQDRALAAGQLEIEQWERASRHFQFGNPSLYTGEAVFSIMSLFHRDREPFAERAEAATARMRAIPAFLAQGRANVTTAPADWTARAIREAQAGVAYFGGGIGLLAEEFGIADPDFAKAAEIAESGFKEHLAWLEADLSRQPSENCAAGREAFDLILRNAHQLRADQNAEWVLAYARDALAKAQAELEARAARLDPSKTWQEQLAGLADLHPSLDDYHGRYQRVWDEARRAAIDADLVTWPDFPIEYRPIPPSDRGAAPNLYYLFYRCPAPFGRPETHRYRVTPIESDMSVEQRERLLRANNDSVIKLNHVVHHGGLGHHVQNWNAFRAESRVGKVAGVDGASRLAMLCAGTLVEGWACYATDLAEEIGMLTPLEALSEQQSRARLAARAVADASLHTGAMTLDETAAFYEREAGMPPSTARGEAVKNSMFPGGAMMYLIGTQAIHDLRRRLAARPGFSLKAFHDQFLSFGATPAAMIAEAMTEELEVRR